MRTLVQKSTSFSTYKLFFRSQSTPAVTGVVFINQDGTCHPCSIGADCTCLPDDDLKDLDEIENWLRVQDVSLIRKPHFGIQVNGVEHNCQQALAELLWGETPFSTDPVTEVTHSGGLKFNLQRDARLLPLVGEVDKYLSGLQLRRTIGLVAKAEEQLGGRFTDDAVCIWHWSSRSCRTGSRVGNTCM